MYVLKINTHDPELLTANTLEDMRDALVGQAVARDMERSGWEDIFFATSPWEGNPPVIRDLTPELLTAFAACVFSVDLDAVEFTIPTKKGLPLAEIIINSARIASLEADLSQARAERDELFKKAIAAGCKVVDIAKAAGVRRSYIYERIGGEKE